jgi:hypothetical protein
MMPGNEQGYDYKFAIAFNIGLHRCTIQGNESISPIDAENRAGCKGLVICNAKNNKETLNINSREHSIEPQGYCKIGRSCNEASIGPINAKNGAGY